MKTITIEKNGLSFTIQAGQQEVDLNQHITLIANIFNVQVAPKPKEPEIITDPSRLLTDKLYSETVFDIIARTQRDPFLSYTGVAKELSVNPQTIKKYCKYGLIEGEHDGKHTGASTGWLIRRSEVDRLKANPNWLKEARQFVKNKPEPAPSDIIHKKRVEILHEIDDLRRNREPLNPGYAYKHYQGLYARAQRYFGSWFNALYVAGIHYSQAYKQYGLKGRPKMQEAERQLKKAALLLKIQQLNKSGMLDEKAKKRLSSEVRYYLGGWRAILGNKRSKENIIAEIRELCARKTNLSYSNVVKNYCALLGAARNHFGNWPNAVKAAGLDYSRIRIRNRKTKEEYLGLREENIQSELLCV